MADSSPRPETTGAGKDPAEPSPRDRLPEEAIAADVALTDALGNATRYEALRHVAAASDGVCVCELEPVLGVGQSAVSQALSRLYAAGLVTRRKEGRWRYYEATTAAETLLSALDAIREADDD